MIATIMAIAALSTRPLLLTNGKIWTGDTSPRFVQAVAINGGLIIAAGTNEEAARAAGPLAHTIDLHGRLAVPGLIDNHVHFIDGGFELAGVKLRDAATAQELARRIGAFAKTLPKGEWIMGGGWDHQLWTPPQLPTRQMIDAVTPDNPVFVSRFDGHMALANSLALKLAGVTRDSKDPVGGTIVRDASGEPTGILKDAAQGPVFAAIPSATTEQRMRAARTALAEAARHGVTTFGDVSSGEAFEDFRAYQRLEKTGQLTARVYLFTPISQWERLANASVERGFGSDRLHIGGVKGFADGSLGSDTAAFKDPLNDDPSNRGLLTQPMQDGSMKRWVTEANARNLQVAIHAIGDRANDQVLAIYESLPNEKERRFRIEHAQHLDPSLIKRFADDRVIASMQPYHAIDDGRWAEKKIGHERARYTYPFRSLLDAGAILTFGSDWTVAPLEPILGIYAAVTRRTIDGKNPHGWIPEQKITVEEALRCYTVNNAYALFAENELGRIVPGLRGDVVVLSQDLFAIDPAAIENVAVDMTIVGGDVVFQRE